MNTAILNIKTDPETKKQLKEFAAQVGLPVSALMNAQIKQMLRSGSVEFSTDEIPNAATQKQIKQAVADYKAGKNIYGPFDTAEDMIAALEK